VHVTGRRLLRRRDAPDRIMIGDGNDVQAACTRGVDDAGG
jgi:hypothetical protein